MTSISAPRDSPYSTPKETPDNIGCGTIGSEACAQPQSTRESQFYDGTPSPFQGMMHVSSASSSRVHNVMMRPPAGYSKRSAERTSPRPSSDSFMSKHHVQVVPESPPVLSTETSHHPFRAFHRRREGMNSDRNLTSSRISNTTFDASGKDIIPEFPERNTALPTDGELFRTIKNPFGAFLAGGRSSGSPISKQDY